jgi:hypothetical protein
LLIPAAFGNLFLWKLAAFRNYLRPKKRLFETLKKIKIELENASNFWEIGLFRSIFIEAVENKFLNIKVTMKTKC